MSPPRPPLVIVSGAPGTFEPLDLGIETIRVDTTNGYGPSLDDLVGQVRTAFG